MDEEYMQTVRNRIAIAIAQELVPVMVDMVRRSTARGGGYQHAPPAAAVARCLRDLAANLDMRR